MRRVLITMAWLAVGVGVMLGWMQGVPRLEHYAHAQTQLSPLQAEDTVRVRFVDLPAWVNAELLARLTLTAQQQLGRNPLSRHDLAAASESLLSSGWFERIEQVRRIEIDLVEVRARMADPFALIRDAQQDHLVDRQGRLLPYSVPPGAAPRLIVITGARFKRPTQLRVTWDGDDVAAGLRVLRLIDDRPWRDQVRAVDVSQYLAKQQVRLVTDRDTTILWGRAPGSERSAEVPAAQKINYLDRLHAKTGRVDGGFPTEIDISGDRVSTPGTPNPAASAPPAKGARHGGSSPAR